MPNQSPAPVAGAVEALVADARLAMALIQKRDDHYCRKVIRILDRLAALHPQPAPAVAVEAERALFEAKFPKPAGVEWIGDGYEVKDSYANSYACDRYVGRWTTWLAARSAPAVAEKVPLMPNEILNGYHQVPEARSRLGAFTDGVRFAEKHHGIGSGSAQEGQANG